MKEGLMERRWRITGYIPSHKQFSLSPKLSPKKITAATGVEPTKPNHSKSTLEWRFYASRYIEREDGQPIEIALPCVIWDYYGARWSAYGPAEAFREIGLLPAVCRARASQGNQP